MSHNEQEEEKENLSLVLQIVEVERMELTKMWAEEKINLRTRNKLSSTLDHLVQHKRM